METRDFRKDIEGFEEIQKEVTILRKYAFDYSSQKGRASQIVNLLHPKTLHLGVAEIRQETPSTKIFRLVSSDSYLPPFQAGQYINLSVEAGGVRTSRPYSIASPPNQVGYYEIAVRRAEGGFVSNFFLDELRAGDRMESDLAICLARGLSGKRVILRAQWRGSAPQRIDPPSGVHFITPKCRAPASPQNYPLQ